MEGTDVSYWDGNFNNDHTYFGNGCADTAGSDTSCSTRITETYDHEDQFMGAYYNFQAATSGTGGGMTTNNANSPDTFCPLGWQLPYGGSGGDYYDKPKSWTYLFNLYDIQYGEWQNPTEEQRSYTRKLRSYPHSYIQAGRYVYGKLYDMTGTAGRYWSGTVDGPGLAYRLGYWIDYGSLTNVGNRSEWQFSVRCVCFHRRHGGRK